MKNYYHTGILIAIMLIVSSCSEYLKENNYNNVLPKTPEDYGALIYAQLSSLETTPSSVTLESYKRAIEKELYADNLNASMNKGRSLKVFYVGDGAIGNMYVLMRGYKEIKDYNIVLDALNASDSISRTLSVTARIMRAVAYYNLMRDYCDPWNANSPEKQMGLPLVTEFNMESRPGRSSLQETAEFIIKELQTAINDKQENEEMYFTTDVAKAYLARTYFWSEKWEKALPICLELLNKYPLLQGKEYTNMLENKLQRSGNILIMSNTGYSVYTYDRDVNKLKERPLSIGFYKLFSEKEKDIRFKYIDKKLRTTKTAFTGVRGAEFALMGMECLAHLGRLDEALKMLNDFRSHRITDYSPYIVATLPPVDHSALIKIDAEGKPLTPLMQAILNERRKELMLENDRWYELKRNGMPEFWVTDGRTKKITRKYLYNFPFQLRDYLINPELEINPGYVYQN